MLMRRDGVSSPSLPGIIGPATGPLLRVMLGFVTGTWPEPCGMFTATDLWNNNLFNGTGDFTSGTTFDNNWAAFVNNAAVYQEEEVRREE